MSVNALLSRLEAVRETGPGRWLARCPAHNDKNPSLSIRELDDGRILIHCFAACGGAEIMGALGLTLSDLYPQSLSNRREGFAQTRPGIHPVDVLKTLQFEATLVALVALDIAGGKQITDADVRRCAAAAGRINAAIGGAT
jgi:hypothetical protein